MNVFKKIARSVRGYNGDDTLQSYYGAVAQRNQVGGPSYHESKRDFHSLRGTNDRYMLF